jgi:hypothetical protein
LFHQIAWNVVNKNRLIGGLMVIIILGGCDGGGDSGPDDASMRDMRDVTDGATDTSDEGTMADGEAVDVEENGTDTQEDVSSSSLCEGSSNGSKLTWNCDPSTFGFSVSERAEHLPLVVGTHHAAYILVILGVWHLIWRFRTRNLAMGERLMRR